jgi:hypothetical protein
LLKLRTTFKNFLQGRNGGFDGLRRTASSIFTSFVAAGGDRFQDRPCRASDCPETRIHRQTVTISWIADQGVSGSSIATKDDRREPGVLLYDQHGVQKIIGGFSALISRLSEKSKGPNNEGTN